MIGEGYRTSQDNAIGIRGFSHCLFARALVTFRWPKRERSACVAVGTALMAHAAIGTGDDCWPSTDTLAAESGVSRPTVIRARLALRDAGFITWTKQARAHGYRYQLTIPNTLIWRGQMKASPQSLRGQMEAPPQDGRGQMEAPPQDGRGQMEAPPQDGRGQTRTPRRPSRSNKGTQTNTEELKKEEEEEKTSSPLCESHAPDEHQTPDMPSDPVLDLAERLKAAQGFQCSIESLAAQIRERMAMGASLEDLERELEQPQWRNQEPWEALDAVKKRLAAQATTATRLHQTEHLLAESRKLHRQVLEERAQLPRGYPAQVRRQIEKNLTDAKA